MNVWVLIPTAQRPHAKMTVAKWAEKGYKIGLFVDPGPIDIPFRDLLIQAKYPGVWSAWNALAKAAIAIGADVCVLAGDDHEPDPELMAAQMGARYLNKFPSGLGILQPVGDKQGSIIGGKWNSQRICGSPVMGREWIKRAYQGNGPVDARFGAFFADESLLHVANKLGVLFQDFGTQHKHLHWSFPGGLPRQSYHERNDREHWTKDKALFEESLKAGFPEGALLGV